MTIREQIINALKTRMELISVSDTVPLNKGTYTFITSVATVDIWRLASVEEDDVQSIEIRDLADPLESQGITNRTDHNLGIELSIATKDSTASTLARNAMQDVLAAIGTDQTLGGLAYHIEVTQRAFEVEEESNLFAGAIIGLVVKYRTDKWQL